MFEQQNSSSYKFALTSRCNSVSFLRSTTGLREAASVSETGRGAKALSQGCTDSIWTAIEGCTVLKHTQTHQKS